MSLTTHSTKRNRAYPRKFDHEEAQRLYAEGWTWASLAAKYGVSPAAIRRVCVPEVRARMAATTRRNLTATCEDCGGYTTLGISPHRNLDRLICPKCAGIRKREATLLRRLNDAGDLRCSRCEEYKPIGHYLIISGFPGERCRECGSAMRRDYRHRHLEEDRAYHRARYLARSDPS